MKQSLLLIAHFLLLIIGSSSSAQILGGTPAPAPAIDLTGVWTYQMDNTTYTVKATRSTDGYRFQRLDCSDKFFIIEWKGDGFTILLGSYYGVAFPQATFTMPTTECGNGYANCIDSPLTCSICRQSGWVAPAKMELANNEGTELITYQRNWRVKLLYNCDVTTDKNGRTCNKPKLAANCCEPYLENDYSLICRLFKVK